MATLRKKLIVISSRDRDTGTPANFNVSFTDGKLFSDTHRVRVNKVSIPNSFHNVKTSGASLYYEESTNIGVTRIFALAAGQYSVGAIISAFNTFVTSYGGSASLALDPITNKFTMTSPGNITVFGLSDPIEDLGFILGFEPIDYATTTAVAIRFPDLSGETTIYLHMNYISQNCITPVKSKLASDVISMIQMKDVSFGETLHYTGDDYDSIEFPNGLNTSDFRIYLTDGENNQLDLNGLEWEMSLIWYYHA